MLSNVKLFILFLVQLIPLSFSATCFESPFDDNDLIEALKMFFNNVEREIILDRVENDVARLDQTKDNTAHEEHYLHYLFANFPEQFAYACNNNNGLNNPFLVLLNEQELLPKKYTITYSRGYKFIVLCKAHTQWANRPPQQLPPLPDPKGVATVPRGLDHLFRDAQHKPRQELTYDQLRQIFMHYAARYPMNEPSYQRRVYFKNSLGAKVRRSRLKEAFFMLVAEPFYKLIDDGFYQSQGEIVGGLNLAQHCLIDPLANSPVALAPHYLIQTEHLYPAHLSIGHFYMVPEAALIPTLGQLHLPIEQSLPPPAGEDQVIMGQASDVKNYLIPVEYLYSAHLPTGRYCLVPGAGLSAVYDQLQIAMADSDIPEIGQYLEDEVEVEPMRNEPARQVQPDFIDFDELFDIGDYPTQMQEQEMPQSPFHEWPQSSGQMPLQQQHQQLASPAFSSASHASTKGHSSEKAAPPRQAYLIRPDNLPFVVLNNERFFLVSEKNLNFYEREQPQQRQLDLPMPASASQDQSDFIDLEGLSEDPVQMQRHEMPQSSRQVPLQQQQQQQQLGSPVPPSSIQDHPDFIDFSGPSNFSVDPDEFLNPNWPQPQYPGEQPMQPQQQQLSSLSTAPVGPSSEVQFQAYQQQPMPPAIAVQQSPPVTTPHPESTLPIQWSDTDIEEFQWSDTYIEEFLQGMALPNQPVNGSGGSNGTSHQGHDEF